MDIENSTKSALQGFVIIILCLTSFQSLALSCMAKTNRVIAYCEKGSCNQPIFIKEFRGRFGCSRMPVILDAPGWSSDILEYEISKANKEGIAVFELEMPIHFWADEPEFSSLSSYKERYDNEFFAARYPANLVVHPSLTIDEVIEHWKIEESNHYYRNLRWVLADYTSFALFAIWTLLTLRLVRKRLFSASAKTLALFSTISQITMFITAIYFTGWEIYLISLFVLIIPVIWLFKAGYFAYFKIRERVAS